jgi:hypothetical protein
MLKKEPRARTLFVVISISKHHHHHQSSIIIMIYIYDPGSADDPSQDQGGLTDVLFLVFMFLLLIIVDC